MKKTIFLPAVLAMLAGCAKDECGLPENGQCPVTFDTIEARTAAPASSSKTTLVGLEMLWSEGDAINVAADPAFSGKPYSISLHEFTISSGAGEKSAVFTSDTPLTGTVMYAAYPASSYTKEGEKYIYFDYPSVQNYVPDGIEDGIIPMYAHAFTDPSDVKFMYGSGILRINLYSEKNVAIEKIIVTTDEPASGVFVVDPALERMPRVKNGTNTQTRITYNVGGVTLGNDPSTPTQFNICVANTVSNGAKVTESGTYAEMRIDIYATDGSMFTKIVKDQVIEGGVIYSKSPLAYDGKLSYKIGDYYPNPEVDTDDPESVAAVEGIVFEVDETGEHGKIFSLDEGAYLKWSLTGTVNNTDDKDNGQANSDIISGLENADPSSIQYPAFDWAASLGEGWYIPAVNELVAIHTLRGDLSTEKNALNNKLLDVSGTPFSEYFYYSSTEYDIPDGEGGSQRNRVYAVNFKRASSAADLLTGALKNSSDSNGCVYRAVKKF